MVDPGRMAKALAVLLLAWVASARAAEPAPPELRLPVSLNAVMVALINHSADPIWLAAWRNPESDRDWRELELMAYQLQIAGALLVVPGSGPMDQAWTSDPAWQEWSNKLRVAGKRAMDSIKTRDIERVAMTGDELVGICEGCHARFKPALPTGGEFGELSPTAEDFPPVDAP
ncbi:MAG: hypothetical protein RIC56_07305 [Pseudomonadales bacterium]